MDNGDFHAVMDNGDFHARIASIIETLANTAVVEICKLVDDGYADLCLVISQDRKEKEVLKRRLTRLERTFSNSHSVERRRGKVNQDDAAPVSVSARTAGGDTQTMPSEHTQALPEPHRSHPGVQEVTVLKSEPQTEQVNQGLHNTASEYATGGDNPRTLLSRKTTTSGQSEPHTSEMDLDSVFPYSGSSLGFTQTLQPEVDTAVDTVPVKVEECVSPLTWNMVTYPGSVMTQPQCNNFLGHRKSVEPSLDNNAASSHSRALKNNASGSKVVPADLNGHVPQISLVSEITKGQIFKSEPTELLPLHSAPNKMEAEGDSVWKMDASLEMGHTQPGRIIESRETEEQQGYAASFRSGADAQATASVTVTAFGEGVPSACAPLPPEGSSAVPKIAEARRRERRFFCSFCGKSFNRPKKVEIHQRVHTGERPYVCTQCGKTFAKSSCLKVHLRMHSGERPHVCSLCGKTFSQAFNLRVHQRVHTGERPYVCGTCGMDFSHLKSLNIHNRQTHASSDWANSL